MNIIKKTIPFTFYFLYFAAGSFALPYIVLYYQEQGFSGTQIGLLMAIMPLVVLVGAPLWTSLADITGKHKLFLTLAFSGAIISISIFPLVKTLGAIILVVFSFALFSSPLVSFSDSATMAMLGGEKQMYGRVRLGGTIGWGLMAPLAGLIIQSFGLRWAFWGYAIIMVLALIVSQKFTFGIRTANLSFKGDIRKILTNRRWVYFLILAFIGGVGLAALNSYMAPYMESLGISRSTMGIALTISTIGELPVLFFANRLLKRFGAYGLLGIGMVATGVRALLYAWLSFPLGILVFQLLNGMTYPMVWVAGVSYADQNAPERMKATAQGLFGAMVSGFGAATGGFLSGLFLGSLGGRWMYLIIGCTVLSGFAVISLLSRGESRSQAKEMG